MVSKASDDLPEPETPVTTVSALCGISKSIFLRLWTRTPRTTMLSLPVRSGAGAINVPLYNAPVYRCAFRTQCDPGRFLWSAELSCSYHQNCSCPTIKRRDPV